MGPQKTISKKKDVNLGGFGAKRNLLITTLKTEEFL